MTKKTGRKIDPAIKARIAPAAVRGEATTADLMQLETEPTDDARPT